MCAKNCKITFTIIVKSYSRKTVGPFFPGSVCVSCSAFTSATSAFLEVNFFNVMRSINLRLTYLLRRLVPFDGSAYIDDRSTPCTACCSGFLDRRIGI